MFTVRLENNTDIYCNEEFYQKIHPPFFKKSLAIPKVFTTFKEVGSWFYSLEYKVAKNYLLFLLARRDYLKKTLEDKLKSKEISKKNSEKLLEEFEALGFIDDRRMISSLIKKYQETKSLREIKSLLYKKGVDFKKYQDLFQEISETQELEVIKKLVERKKGKERQKIFAYLYRKGFTIASINNVLNNFD